MPLSSPRIEEPVARALYGRGYQLVTLCSDVALLVEEAGGLVARFRQEIQSGS